MTRQHRQYAARIDQIRYNLLAIAGGRPYIDARLQRAPNEADLSWAGSSTDQIPGRKQRAFLINDAGRVAAKIEQYLFAQPVTRDGIDEVFAEDVTTTGLTIQSFWRDVCTSFTGGQWVVLQADRGAPMINPETGKPVARTLAQRDAAGDRIYWSMWPSTDVVDWCFDSSGRLLWCLCQDTQYQNADPFAEAKQNAVRILWRRGSGSAGATFDHYIEDDKGELKNVRTGQISIPEIPLEFVGVPSSTPWWFDDVEMIQCALMNLSSLNHENLVKTVYPQLVVPTTMIENVEAKLVEQAGMNRGTQITELVHELIRGLDRPFVEDKDNANITRYLQPSSMELKALPEEEDRRRRQLFDVAGLALFNRETRQVQTAESKQFDHLDTASTLRNRSKILQDAEKKMVALSKRLDANFKEYTPIWPMDFDVPNTNEEVAALTQLANFTELTPTMRQQVLRVAVKLMDQIERIPEAVRAQIAEEIEAIQDLTVDTQVGGAVEIGKVPLAVQQLALARQRAMEAGDADLARSIGAKIEELVGQV